MPRKKALAVSSATGGSAALAAKPGFMAGFTRANSPRPKKKARQLKPQDLTNVLRNLATLVGNGVSLPKALATLAQEDSLAKCHDVLEAVRRKVETGAPFSTALAECMEGCDQITASQIRVGERAGKLAESLR